jgi:aryl-alcohol dehydrogenase-like predicted oxidoreductase
MLMNLYSYRTLGRSGLRVSPIALGAMTFGDGSWGGRRPGLSRAA